MIEPPKAQADKFCDPARQVECDDNEEAFKAKLRQVAKSNREPKSPPKPER